MYIKQTQKCKLIKLSKVIMCYNYNGTINIKQSEKCKLIKQSHL